MIIKMKKLELCLNDTLNNLSEGTLGRKSLRKALQFSFLIKCKFKNKTKNNKKTKKNKKKQKKA